MTTMENKDRKPGSYIDAFDFDECIECGDCLYSCKYMDFDQDESIEGIQSLRQGTNHEAYLDQCVFCAQCNQVCPVEARPAALLMERLRERRRAVGDLPGFFAYYLNGMGNLGCEENYFKDIYLASSEANRLR